MQVVGETLPNSPLPPENSSLAVADSDTLTLSWDADAVGGVSKYVAVLRCNEQSPQEKEVSGTTSVDFDVSDPAPNFAWCTAQVQSENDVGRGQFSQLVSAAIPSSAPSDPRCYLVDDQGSSVTFTFDVTDPFSLDSLSLRYKLIADYEDESEVSERSEVFEGDNRLMLSVARNTMYSFRLRLCNTHGCSQYCSQLTNFTTSSVSSSILYIIIAGKIFEGMKFFYEFAGPYPQYFTPICSVFFSPCLYILFHTKKFRASAEFCGEGTVKFSKTFFFLALPSLFPFPPPPPPPDCSPSSIRDLHHRRNPRLGRHHVGHPGERERLDDLLPPPSHVLRQRWWTTSPHRRDRDITRSHWFGRRDNVLSGNTSQRQSN